MSKWVRAIYGFVFGILIFTVAINIFVVNDFDYQNIRNGIEIIISGKNPWSIESRIPHFYNPPHSLLFLWPLKFFSPRFILVLGAGLLIAFAFMEKSWVSLAWFFTNSALYIVAAGGIDMYVVGGGLLLLFAGDSRYNDLIGLLLRVIGFGLLMVKPQGTIFIVFLYILLRRDWKGVLLGLVLYGLPFLHLYPDWLRVILFDPPLSQTVAAHTLLKKFGPIFAVLVAGLVISVRRWKFWQLGGALAGILSPYGMPGIPILLTLGAVSNLKAIPIIILYSAGLATMTWITPPADVDFYAYLNPLLSIYHIGMLGIALALACISIPIEQENSSAPEIDIPTKIMRLKSRRGNC